MRLMTRWQPFTDLWREMDRLHEEMDRLFERFGMGEEAWRPLAATFPPVNIWEDENNLYAEAELPGLQMDQVEVYVTGGNQLTIRGERRPEEVKGTWHRQERGFGPFSRTISLPVPVDADKVQARFEHGVLHITLPKTEAARPRRIPVKAS